VSVALAVFVWLCVASAADRAGWPLTPTWWGTSSARIQTVRDMLQSAPDAASSARSVVHTDPMGRASLSYLGEAFWLIGETNKAARAYQLAAVNSWRDESAQAWAIQAAFDNGDLPQAALHLDALLRVAPEVVVPLEWWAILEKSSVGRAALAARLSHSPEWAKLWLKSVVALPPSQLDYRIEMIKVAKIEGMAIPRVESVRATWQMLKSHPSKAFAFWQSVAGVGDTLDRGIWDADFKQIASDYSVAPFEWRRTDTTGVSVGTQYMGELPVLMIDDLTTLTTNIIETDLVLPTGTHTVEWTVSDPDLPVRFTVRCIDANAALTIDGSESRDARRVLRFRTPAGCPRQRLVLTARSDASAPAGGFISSLRVA
jgi:hypothetical protein